MRVISLFSGAGGLDLGFIQAGHEVVWANDSDRDCVETYERNISQEVALSDIKDVTSSAIPDGDIVIGGFPCQGFSVANLRRTLDDGRNSLYLEFLRVIREKQPRYFLAENVKGILSLDGGKAISRILADFREAGFRVKHRLVNAADYGVPQTRMRVIIIGTRRDIPPREEPDFPRCTHSREPVAGEGLMRWVTISEALEGIPDPDSSHALANHVYSKYMVNHRNFTGHRVTDPNRPSPTILARGNGKGGVCALPHPSGTRRLTVRESAIIQTFPLDFIFCGKLNSTYRQVGNAVPVLLARRLGEEFKKVEDTCDGR